MIVEIENSDPRLIADDWVYGDWLVASDVADNHLLWTAGLPGSIAAAQPKVEIAIDVCSAEIGKQLDQRLAICRSGSVICSGSA